MLASQFALFLPLATSLSEPGTILKTKQDRVMHESENEFISTTTPRIQRACSGVAKRKNIPVIHMKYQHMKYQCTL